MDVTISIVDSIYQGTAEPLLDSPFLLESNYLDNYKLKFTFVETLDEYHQLTDSQSFKASLLSLEPNFTPYESVAYSNVHTLIYKDKTESQVSDLLNNKTKTLTFTIYETPDFNPQSSIPETIVLDLVDYTSVVFNSFFCQLVKQLYQKGYLNTLSYNLYIWKYPFYEWKEHYYKEFIHNITYRNLNEEEIILT